MFCRGCAPREPAEFEQMAGHLYCDRMASKLPTGSGASSPTDARPRAQVSYEGQDEFSAMSLDPERRKSSKQQQKLTPSAPGEKQEMKVDELKSTNQQGFFGLLRKIFAK